MSGHDAVNGGNGLVLLPSVLTVNNLNEVADFAEESVYTGSGFFGEKGVEANDCDFNGVLCGCAELFRGTLWQPYRWRRPAVFGRR